MLDAFGAIADTENRRYAVLSGNDGTVREDTADIGDQTDSVRKQLRPSGSGQWTNQYGTRLHLFEL